MSYPCGSYNSDTLKILKEMKIEIGFKQLWKLKKTEEWIKLIILI